MQQARINLAPVKILAGLAILLSSFGFTAMRGGEVYKIYLNNKLLMEGVVSQPVTVKDLQLTEANVNDQLVIYYYHCGTVGKGRSIAIKDDRGTTIKEWKYADGSGSNAGMTIPVKELLQLEKSRSGVHLSIYYASQELPHGRMLTSLAKR